MAITQRDLECFSQFAWERLNSGGGVESLAWLVREWEAQREREETIEDIRQGQADIESGLGRPIEEVFAEIRERLGTAK
jgi:hypothetical protein